jgi:hypothetical protein
METRRFVTFLFVVILLLVNTQSAVSWGFFAHKRINRLAVFALPPEMMPFFKTHIVYLTENAVNPDKRRYAVEGEAERHYIDLDIYGDSAWYKVPHRWEDAVKKYTEDTLKAYGIVPWHIIVMKYRLTAAMKKLEGKRILSLAADIGHYIGDANVPLHTTENYNGQKTGQYGIHGFWESRLPELFSDNYDFFVGKAEYESDIQKRAWDAVWHANIALDSVFGYEKELSVQFTEDKKYSFEQRGNVTTRVYSYEFSKAYHDKLAGQVERRMRATVKMVADIWYTCWVDAGKPNLDAIIDLEFTEEEKKQMEEEQEQWRQGKIEVRPEASNYHPAMWLMGCCCSPIHFGGADLQEKNMKNTEKSPLPSTITGKELIKQLRRGDNF